MPAYLLTQYFVMVPPPTHTHTSLEGEGNFHYFIYLSYMNFFPLLLLKQNSLLICFHSGTPRSLEPILKPHIPFKVSIMYFLMHKIKTPIINSPPNSRWCQLQVLFCIILVQVSRNWPFGRWIHALNICNYMRNNCRPYQSYFSDLQAFSY